MKNFYSVKDVANLPALVQQALDFQKDPLKMSHLGAKKRVGLIFFNPSLRTRLSTQIAAKNLGMEAIVLNSSTGGGADNWALEFQDGAIMNGTTVEHIKDAAPILGSFFDILCVRSFPKLQSKTEDESEIVFNSFLKYAGVPIVSLESATRHPLQSLADVITIEQTFEAKRSPKIVMAWAPHIKPIPHCVANSFAEWMNAAKQVPGKLEGANFVVAHPPGLELSSEYIQDATVTHDLTSALQGADYVYLKNWSGYTDTTGYGKMIETQPKWLLKEEHFISAANSTARIMHCLPLRRNVEVADEILDGKRSLLTTQAKNRVWSAQTVLAEILKGLN